MPGGHCSLHTAHSPSYIAHCLLHTALWTLHLATVHDNQISLTQVVDLFSQVFILRSDPLNRPCALSEDRCRLLAHLLRANQHYGRTSVSRT